jgi:aminobenzoyl-glutamate utilization protein B
MATPIAHKGTTAGAQALAMTVMDIVLRPELVTEAWRYFREVQTAGRTYEPLIRPDDPPATWLNTEVMARYRPRQRPFYYDPARFATYLEQLGVAYPSTRAADGSCPAIKRSP